MKSLKYLFLIFIVACSSTNIVYDYDGKTDFKVYRTFNFFEDAGKGLNELNVKRVTNEITNVLQQKDMKLAENPDMYINILSKENKKIERGTIGIGIGGGQNVGFGISGGIPIGSKKINEELLIDFVDGKTNQLIWQGISNNQLKENASPDDRRVYYAKIIVKMLSNYPPKK